MPGDLTERLLADWNYYRLQTHHFHKLNLQNIYPKDKKMTDETREVLVEMQGWCREKGLEPRLWMYALFKLRNWMAAPKLSRGCLMSERLIPRYKKMTGVGFFRRRRQASDREAREEESFDPNRDLNHALESVKLQYIQAGRASVCKDQILEKTLGWHPQSKACRICPVAAECAIKLCGYVRFDIIGLRTGKVTSREAQQAVEDQLE